MKLSINITKGGAPLEGVTAMIIDGPDAWPEIAALSNEAGEVSFQVEAAGMYKVRLFTENAEETIAVKTGEKKEYAF